MTCCTCISFRDDWRDMVGVGRVMRMRGFSFGAAFLSLYLPETDDRELRDERDEERAWNLIQERYST